MPEAKKIIKLIIIIFLGGLTLFLSADKNLIKNLKTEIYIQPDYSQPPPWANTGSVPPWMSNGTYGKPPWANNESNTGFQPDYSQPSPWSTTNSTQSNYPQSTLQNTSITEKNKAFNEFMEKNKNSLKILKKLKIDTAKADKVLDRIEPLVQKRAQAQDLPTMIKTNREIFDTEDYLELFNLLTKENINKDKSGKLFEILKANINFLQTNVEQEKLHGKDTTAMENAIKKMKKTENDINKNKNKKTKTKSSKSKTQQKAID